MSKREFRELKESTKKKIAQKLTGKKKSQLTKAKISKSMKAYWKNIPSIINNK